MLTIPKSTKLQSAADDAYVIGETVETLGKLLDRFYERHGEQLGLKLETAIPFASDITPKVASAVFALAHSLQPPSDEGTS